LGHHGLGHFSLGHGGHHFYPHFDFHVSPWYGGYGYSSYNLPYYSSGSYYYGNRANSVAPAYVQQVQPSLPRQGTAKPVTTSQGLVYQRRAEAAFRAGDFQRAAQLANHALVEMPRDGKLLLFTAQSFLAVGNYRGAAAAIHQAAALLDSDQWGYVVENYRRYYRGRAYIDQMDRLNEYIKKNPTADYAYFLRGYQHGFLGHQKSALRDLNKAVKLESRDQLAAKLIERFGGTSPATNTPNPGDRSATAGKSIPANIPVPDATVLAAMSKLSLADRTAALAQRTCPVTGDTLGSDGTPIKIQVGGRGVFVCCDGCVADLQKEPGKYLTAAVR
jgi:tetratricopeptide (TPR) repeat protein